MSSIKLYLRDLISEKLDIKAEDIETDMAFFTIGISSIISEEIVMELSEHFEGISSTILFEYPNIDQLSEYLSSKEIKGEETFLKNIEKNSDEEVKENELQEINKLDEVVKEPKTEEASKSDNHCKEAVKDAEYENHDACDDEIAIIGLSCKVPGAESAEEFWSNLINNKNSIEIIPAERWDYLKYYNENIEKGNSTYSKWGGFIKDVDKFDPLFFNISPKEADMMDPNEKLFLTACWQAMEDAGYGNKKNRKDNKVGVYVGITWNEFSLIAREENLKRNEFTGGGSLYWRIPNRVSYFMDFNGPSIALDSACSSSLSALHQACQAIKGGDCSMAIAGGINLNLHPSKYIYLSEGRFLSVDGQCKSFAEGGNGYVPGEGVVSLVLKKLSEAEKDNDNIYGIIKSTAVNHGGKATGYTVPNPKAQSDVIYSALKDANISAEEVSYVECHGTGTSLGDPIEIQGLKNAFDQYTDEKQFCYIGSVKANIGHLEAAAGLVGVVKILLMMKNNMIPANLFSENLNKRINFKDSQFKLVKENTPLAKKSNNGTSICTVSSFGAGGSNAHAVIESYNYDKEIKTDNDEYQVILSAMSKEQVIEYAIELKKKLKEVENSKEYTLRNISETLKLGREIFKYSAVIEARSLEELREKIDELISDGIDSNYIFKKDKVENIIVNNDKEYKKISLPTYPFLKEKSWINNDEVLYTENKVVKIKNIQPMIQENLSDFSSQKYKVTLDGTEFFLRDHWVGEEMVLPGVAYIELAREAGELAIGSRITEIRNILFLKPIKVKTTAEVIIELTLQDDIIDFKISLLEDEEWAVCCQGELLFNELEESSTESFDIKAIQERCNKHKNNEEVYSYLHNINLNIRESFMSIKYMDYGEKEAIGRLELPEHLNDDFSKFKLHPSLMDGALQVPPAAELRGVETYINLPFSIKSVKILKSLNKKCYAYTYLSSEINGNKKFDVRILDDNGKPAIVIDDFWARAIEVKNKFEMLYYSPVIEERQIEAKIAHDLTKNIVIFDMDKTLITSLERELENRNYKNNKVVFIKPGKTFKKIDDYNYELNIEKDDEYIKLFESIEDIGIDTVIYNFNNLVKDVFDIRNISKEVIAPILYTVKHITKRNEITLYSIYEGTDDVSCAAYQAVSGMSDTINIENKKILLKNISVDKSSSAKKEVILANEIQNTSDKYSQIYYSNNIRYIKKFEENELKANENAELIKSEGTYIITGGAGGLGIIFADYIASTYSNSKIILLGRSQLSKEKQEKINDIAKKGSQIEYVQCDICNESDMRSFYDYCKTKYKSINGIIHAAGVINDSLIIKKEIDEFENVINPKVYGTLNLDKVFKDEDLDFLILFSSLTSVIGNIGQIDYAYGNYFMDEFTQLRERLREKGMRSGKTLSINWPLWKNGGMKVDEESRKFLENTMGFEYIDNNIGIESFEKALNSSCEQVVVVKGNKSKLEGIFNKSIQEETQLVLEEEVYDDTEEEIHTDNKSLKNEVINLIKEIVSQMTGISKSRLELENNLSDYGYDSVGLIKLSNTVNKKFNIDVTPAIFFEYPSIGEFTDYLLDEYKDNLSSILSNNSEEQKRDTALKKVEKKAVKKTLVNKEEKHEKYSTGVGKEDIAIIGVDCIMPKAKDLREYWSNLINNRNCITQIPSDRWDWREYYGDPLDDVNKTNIKWGGFIDDVDKFDAKFFGISPREAELMDPQQRLMLESVWKTVEDAGYKISDLSREKVGVFVGASTNDYFDLQCRNNVDIHAFTTTGSFHSILANRINYIYNFTGPSVPVDTACSSSLVAIREAIESIWTGSCDLAIAGGVNLMLSPTIFISFSKARMLSIDGKCKTFDKDANGYVRGEGLGTILLKPLSKAIKDKDNIYAVIKGSSINHGGKVNTLTAPNPNAQAELIKSAFDEAGIDSSTITYMEAHGTGTSLGDPIEVNGLKKAFKEIAKEHGSKLQDSYCGLGSVKTNIGHLEAGAGISALIKVIMAMKYGEIPATINFKTLNPYIKLENTPFNLILKNTKWNRLKDKNNKEIPRRAGVSSFGFGGVNAHVLLEEYNRKENNEVSYDTDENIFILSAKEEDTLVNYAKKFIEYLDGERVNTQIINDNTVEELTEIIRMTAIEVFKINDKDLINSDNLNDYIDDIILKLKFIDTIGSKLDLDTSLLKDETDLTIDHIVEKLINEYKAHLGSKEEIQESEYTINLNNMLYTLQTGREEMNCRLAIVTNSIDNLIENLKLFVEGNVSENIHVGNINQSNIVEDILDGEEADYFIERLFENRNLDKIAKLWISGAKLDWNMLYDGNSEQKISLPTYPFNKKSYWIPIKNKPVKRNGLLDNIMEEKSSDNSWKFKKVINFKDTIVYQHKINGQCVLPGVAYVSLIKECISKIVLDKNYTIENISWVTSLALSKEYEKAELLIEISYDEKNYEFKAYTIKNNKQNIHCMGNIICIDNLKDNNIKVNNLENIINKSETKFTKDTIYDYFKTIDFELGNYLRTIDNMYVLNQDIFSEVRIDDGYSIEKDDFYVHPTLMDAVFQSIGAKAGLLHSNNRLLMPFSVDKIQFINPMSENGYLIIRKNSNSSKSYDAVILKEDGTISIKMDGIIMLKSKEKNDIVLLKEKWIENRAISADSKVNINGLNLIIHENEDELADMIANKYSESIKLNLETINVEDLEERIKEYKNISNLYFISNRSPVTSMEELMEDEKRSLYKLYSLIKILVKSDYCYKELNLKVITFNNVEVYDGEKITPRNASLQGFIRTLENELNSWNVSLIDFALDNMKTQIDMAVNIEKGECAVRGNKIYHRIMDKITRKNDYDIAWKNDSVYVIIGGTGGIGLTICDSISKNTNSKVILIGRRSINALNENVLQKLEEYGNVEYIQADICNPESILDAIKFIKNKYRHINGVIHSAIVLKDESIINGSWETFEEVLNPKLVGIINLYNAVKNEKLDFMLFLSSIQSYVGNKGQSNYGAASTFEDAIAKYLNENSSFKVKLINWGYWGSVGIVSNKKYNAILRKQGLYSIEPNEGLDVINEILSDDNKQIIAVKASEKYLENLNSTKVILSEVPALNTKVNLSPILTKINDLSENILCTEFLKYSNNLLTKNQYHIDEFKNQLKILPKYTSLFKSIVEILIKKKVIKIFESKIQLIYDFNISVDDIKQQLKDLLKQNPQYASYIKLLLVCTKSIFKVMEGKEEATSVIFENGSLELVRGIYSGNPVANTMNTTMASNIEKAIEKALEKKSVVNILEIGAGTGSTSEIVLSYIDKFKGKVTYDFTDLSQGFLAYGKRKFKDKYDFVNFKVLNIENSPEENNCHENQYDIIIASNVLHATQNIRRTLKNVSKLLNVNGKLFLNELIEARSFYTITFGLLDGWWLFNDEEKRIQGSPLLTCNRWIDELKDVGLDGKVISKESDMGQDIITAVKLK